jgi:hypothetical protein
MPVKVVNIDQRPDRAVLSASVRVELDGTRPVLKPLNLAGWYVALGRQVGKTLRLTGHTPRQRRTREQNAYLWAGVYEALFHGIRMLTEEQGISNPYGSVDDLHEWAKWKFLRIKRVMPSGELEDFPGSSALLSIDEFSVYVEQLCAWGAQRGIYVPRADEWLAA